MCNKNLQSYNLKSKLIRQIINFKKIKNLMNIKTCFLAKVEF